MSGDLSRGPVFSQNKYRESGVRSLSQSVYSQLPETADTQFARSACELQSEVRSRLTSDVTGPTLRMRTDS